MSGLGGGAWPPTLAWSGSAPHSAWRTEVELVGGSEWQSPQELGVRLRGGASQGPQGTAEPFLTCLAYFSTST